MFPLLSCIRSSACLNRFDEHRKDARHRGTTQYSSFEGATLLLSVFFTGRLRLLPVQDFGRKYEKTKMKELKWNKYAGAILRTARKVVSKTDVCLQNRIVFFTFEPPDTLIPSQVAWNDSVWL